MESSSELLALIAGSSQMPLVVAAEAREAGRRVVALAIRGITSPRIDAAVDEVQWLEWGDLPSFFAVLESWRQMGVTEAVMVGKVEQRRIYDRSQQGDAMIEVLGSLPTGHTDQLLGAVANVLSGAGIQLLESTRYLRSLLAPRGVIAGRVPTEAERADIAHGWQVAKQLGALDIGQTVVVKERAVVAVEAMEGTDATIERAASLAGAGCVVVKVAKPDQDLRFDVPVVGAATVSRMVDAGATVLAVEAGITVIFDRDEIGRLADDAGLALWGHVDE